MLQNAILELFQNNARLLGRTFIPHDSDPPAEGNEPTPCRIPASLPPLYIAPTESTSPEGTIVLPHKQSSNLATHKEKLATLIEQSGRLFWQTYTQASANQPLEKNLLTKVQTSAQDLISEPWFIQALKVIEQYHGTQVRKVSGNWYGTEHLLTVAFMANYLFSNEDGKLDNAGIQLVLTALFHDVLEDTDIGKQGLREVLGLIFEIVYKRNTTNSAETDSNDPPKPSQWEWVDQIIANIDILSAPHTRKGESCGVGFSADPGYLDILYLRDKSDRKEAYLERLGNNASLEILLIKLCDRIANLMSDVAYVQRESIEEGKAKPEAELAYTLKELEVFWRCIISRALPKLHGTENGCKTAGNEIIGFYSCVKEALYGNDCP